MNSFVCVLLSVALVAGEPPRYRLFRVSSGEREQSGYALARQTENADAPYPASGFMPFKEFKLPSERQELVPPSTSYGMPDDSFSAPLNIYGAPQVDYGTPRGRSFQVRAGEEKEDSEGLVSTSAERASEESSTVTSEKKETIEKKEEGKENGEQKPKSEKKQNLEDGYSNNDDVINSEGAYYVLLPDSQLQRVQFQTINDVNNMAYTARLQYKNEDRAPVYVYSAVPAYRPSAAYSAYGVFQW